MPRIFGTARLAVLDKGAGPASLFKRLIAVLPIAYLAWSSAVRRLTGRGRFFPLPLWEGSLVAGRMISPITLPSTYMRPKPLVISLPLFRSTVRSALIA